MGLRERSHQLGVLEDTLGGVAQGGQGRLAVVFGEAGIGKTTLVRSFCDATQRPTRCLWGRCDELFTPRPLGPFVDIAAASGGPLAEALRREATPFEIAGALSGDLLEHAPTVVVVEDAHLADEATLDVLRILGGRAGDLPALLVVTYRDEALDRWHPLRIVLGELAVRSRIQRIKLSPLSRDAVTMMAAEHGQPGDGLHHRTGGNPFFVTESLAAGESDIAETVRDVVLGRAARLSAGARALLDAIAVARPRTELWLLEALAGDDIRWLDETLASGMVSAAADAVSFRHELARLAIEEAIPAHRRQALHRAALELLAATPGIEPDPARLAHHAVAVGDPEPVLRFAPMAAAQASRLGAHREAASHFRGALRFADRMPVETRARLLAGAGHELFLILDFAASAGLLDEALREYAKLGDRRMQGVTLTFLAQVRWLVGSLPAGLNAIEEALTLLEQSPDADLVSARCQMASLQLAAEDPGAALTWARRAERLADSIDDPVSRCLALQSVGWVEFFTGAPGGLGKLVESLETAASAGWDSVAAIAYVLIVRTAARLRRYDVAEQYLHDGLAFCIARDFDVWRFYLLAWQSRILLAGGRWSEAAQAADICLTEPCPFARAHALLTRGLVRARRGDPDVWAPLDEMLALAQPRDELQWLAPAATARAEAAWLEGRYEDAIAETEIVYEAAAGTWWAAGLAYWRWRSGIPDEPIPSLGEEQYRLEMQGDWAGASASWRAAGCGYEAAFALIDGDEDSLRSSLAALRQLGANPAARVVAARLRETGAGAVPRGPRPTTRENPAGLTRRETEVLDLVAKGLRNAEIATQLYLSERTIDHHVSAILQKLGVANRVQAVTEATRLGITAQAGRSPAPT